MYYVPTFGLLSSNVVAKTLSHAIFYPLSTIIIKYTTSQLTIKQIPKLFQSQQSFLSLYSGIGYSMLWSVAFQTIYSLREVALYHLILSKAPEERASIFSRLGLGLLFSGMEVAASPLKMKSLFGQADIPYTLTWNMSFYRYFYLYNNEYFRK